MTLNIQVETKGQETNRNHMVLHCAFRRTSVRARQYQYMKSPYWQKSQQKMHGTRWRKGWKEVAPSRVETITEEFKW